MCDGEASTYAACRFNKINGFPLEMAPLFAHPNEGKLRMAVAGNPLLDVEAASGMWTGGVWRPMDVHMPDAQVVQYILEQATMRVVADKVWREEGPFQFPREFTKAWPAPTLTPPPLGDVLTVCYVVLWCSGHPQVLRRKLA